MIGYYIGKSRRRLGLWGCRVDHHHTAVDLRLLAILLFGRSSPRLTQKAAAAGEPQLG